MTQPYSRKPMTDNSTLPPNSGLRAQRWKGWFFSGLISYLIQGVLWTVLGLVFAVWEEVWGNGLIVDREAKIAEGVLVASPLGSILGSAMLYAAIGFIMAGLIHMLAYSIPGGLFWALMKHDSILVRHPWLSWIVGWALGASAMGFFYYGEGGWIWSATVFGGSYGILTAVVCLAVWKRTIGGGTSRDVGESTKARTEEQGGSELEAPGIETP